MPERLICLAGHGDIAAGVASAATLIMGPSDDLRTAPSYTGDVDELRAYLDGLLDEIGPDGRLILVSDLMGGSVSNTMLAYDADPRVSQIAGMTLSMVLELIAEDPVTADGAFDPGFVERVRSMVTPLPLPTTTGTDAGDPAGPTEEEDF
jgi:fructoselysine and glucoselysine-specific PTS system IIA component